MEFAEESNTVSSQQMHWDGFITILGELIIELLLSICDFRSYSLSWWNDENYCTDQIFLYKLTTEVKV